MLNVDILAYISQIYMLDIILYFEKFKIYINLKNFKKNYRVIEPEPNSQRSEPNRNINTRMKLKFLTFKIRNQIDLNQT